MEELILKNREFKIKLVELINNSELPAFILKTIIKEMLEQLNELDKQQYEQALQLKKDKEKEKEEKEEK